MSLLPLKTWVNKDSQLYATTAQLQSLSTSIGAVTISTAQGAGISVTEPTANNFVIQNALSNAGGLSFVTIPGSSTLGLSNAGVTSVAVGTGLSTTGATGSITLANTGVTSVTAGTGISITGTSSAPVINNTNTITQSITNIFTAGLPTATAVGANTNTLIYFTATGGTTIDVVQNKLYCITGTYQLSTTASGYSVDFIVENGSFDIVILNNSPSSFYAPGAPLNNAQIPFSCFVIPQGNTIGMYIGNSAFGGGQTTQITLTSCYITRIT